MSNNETNKNEETKTENQKLIFLLEDNILVKDKKIKKMKSELNKYKTLLLTIHKQTLCMNKLLNFGDIDTPQEEEEEIKRKVKFRNDNKISLRF